MDDVSQFHIDDAGVKHLVITYKSGWETLCKKPVAKDSVFEAKSDFSRRIVTCEICSHALDAQ